MKISSKVKLMLRSLLVKAGELSTDKGVILYDGELEVGIEVFVEVDGEIVPAEDGEYKAEGKTIVVSEGKVTEIREEEVEKVEETVEAEEEPADAPEEQTEEPAIEDRVANLEAAVGEIREGIESLTNAIAALVSRLEAVEEKIKGLEEPGAEPAEQGEETEEKFTSKLNYLRKK
jgi:chromosome segregation ATPase